MKARDFARQLRLSLTDTERMLWKALRARRFQGYKFRRQQPLGNYVVDFVCFEQKLIIELDGGQHMEAKDYDRQRDTWLANCGYRILRFWNNEVLENLEGVLENILATCGQPPSPPAPLPRGERGNTESRTIAPPPLPPGGGGDGGEGEATP